MGQFRKQIRIEAPKHRVWEVLADLGSIYKWNPNVSYSYSTSESGGGEGATRHCDVQAPVKGYLEERAFDWREGEGFKIDVYDTSFPTKSNVVQFRVKADADSTIVEVMPEYRLKFGFFGTLIDRLLVGRQFQKGMEKLLAGLKHYVETGEEVGTNTKLPELAAVAKD